jgi:hypothetical protein
MLLPLLGSATTAATLVAGTLALCQLLPAACRVKGVAKDLNVYWLLRPIRHRVKEANIVQRCSVNPMASLGEQLILVPDRDRQGQCRLVSTANSSMSGAHIMTELSWLALSMMFMRLVSNDRLHRH